MVFHVRDDGTAQEDVRERLVSLGPERLADELLRLAARTDDAAESVERLISTPEENIKRFKTRLAGLKRRRKFVDWQEAPRFARELEGLLADLRAGVDDPKAGAKLVAAFFKCDRSIFERCDDSSGVIGDVFRFDARELFTRYAAACTDKAWLSDQLLTLYDQDDYGVRAALMEIAGEFLPEWAIRDLITHLWERAENEPEGSYQADHWWIGVQLLARQLGDGALYEQAWLRLCREPSAGVCMDIAQVYLETGEAKTALSWVKRIPTSERFRAEERDQLLVAIYERLGDRAGMAEAAWRLFLNHRSGATLNTLLRAIGESERERVVEEQAQRILEEEGVSYADAAFLVEVGRMEEAEAYLLRHAK